MKLDDDIEWSVQGEKVPEQDQHDDYPEGWFTPEKDAIMLPSVLAPGEITCLSLDAIAKVEAELHIGQINDSLNGLHLALGEKSLCFHTEISNASSPCTTQQAWDNIHKFDADARNHRAMYNRT